MKLLNRFSPVIGAFAVVALATSLSAADANVKPDTMTTCPVSGDKLGEMSAPYVFTYKGQEVKLCCNMCKPDFDKDPAKYIKKIEAANKSASTNATAAAVKK